MKNDVIIVGAGASGMVAGICAARRGKKVLIIDRMAKAGKKIYATGNGKCNYTNLEYDYDSYRGEDTSIVGDVLERFNAENTIDFFEELGILAKNKNGYIYPYSEQASSVVEVLLMELDNLGVKILLEENVKKIIKKSYGDIDESIAMDKGNKILIGKGGYNGKEKNKDKNDIKNEENVGYTVVTDKNKHICSKVILATGGMASPKLGSNGSGYALAESLGHSIVTPNKALVQLKTKGNEYTSLSGVRIQGKVTMYIEGEETRTNYGEFVFTDYGISGIPIMQLSRYAAVGLSKNKKVRLELDFYPDIDDKELLVMLKNRQKNCYYKDNYELLIGMINSKLAAYIDKKSNDRLEAMIRYMKKLPMEIVDTNSWDNAQVTAGGVSTKEIDSCTMESKLSKGLYITGELMDIDGTCGGYNLQWAWATGYIAGKNI